MFLSYDLVSHGPGLKFWVPFRRRLEDHKAEKGVSSLQAFDRQLADAAMMTTETGVLKDNMRSGDHSRSSKLSPFCYVGHRL